MCRPIKRVSSFVLVLLLLFMLFAVPAAQPARAIAVSAVVISAVLAAMAVWGIGTVTAGMTAAEIQTWLEGKLNSWASSKSSTVASLIPLSGISVTATALLVLGNAAANAIKDFVNWLSNDLSLTPGTTTGVIQADSSYGGTDMDYFPSGFSQLNYYVQSGGVYGQIVSLNRIFSIGGAGLYVFAWLTGTDNINYQVYSEQPFIVTTEHYNVTTDTYSDPTITESSYGSDVGYYLSTISFKASVYYRGEEIVNDYSFTLRNYADKHINLSIPNTIGQSLSLKTGVSYNLPVDLVDPESLYINSGAAIGATLEGVTEHIITEVTDNTLTVTGTVAEEAPEFEVTGPVEVIGIQNIFPFCIPFDLYSFVSCLAAEPETPAFTWRFYVPGFVDEEIEVDLTPFNTVAAILRTGLLLLFCVGLAFETRKLLRS